MYTTADCKDFDNGKSVDKMSRKHGVHSACFYKRRSKYAGMNSKELKRLKELMYYGINRACRVLNMSKSVYCYKPLTTNDTAIEQALLQKVKEHSEEGFRKAYHRLRNEEKPWNKKRVHRVKMALGPPLSRKMKKRLPARIKEPLETPNELNHT